MVFKIFEIVAQTALTITTVVLGGKNLGNAARAIMRR